MFPKGYNSIFEDIGSKDTTIKIDNQSSIVQNDSMMIGDVATGKHMFYNQNNSSIFEVEDN